jgi:endonuclease/exonuclease/phosphatase family metal-dependent hydrolase
VQFSHSTGRKLARGYTETICFSGLTRFIALRSYLQDRPDEFARIAASRPSGPLAISHIRGNKRKRTECRYDFIYHSPGIRVEGISYLYEEALAAGSDHAVVTAELRAGDD